MGPNSAPSPIAAAPIASEPEDTDLVLINRGGQLQQVFYAGMQGPAGPAMSGLALAENQNDLTVYLSSGGEVVGTLTVTGFIDMIFSSPVALQALGTQLGGTGLANGGGVVIVENSP